MQVTMNECEKCGALFKDDKSYSEHMENHRKISLLNGAFPEVEDEHCDFANGGWNVQRSKKWLDEYKNRIIQIVGDISYKPFCYGWFRCLDDGHSMFYGVACRILNICPTCFREWGQQYFANNCDHKDKERG